MIVPMKKITIISLANNNKNTIEELAKLGLMHISSAELKDSPDRAEVHKRIEIIQKAFSIISSLKIKNQQENSSIYSKKTASEIAEEIIAISEQIANYTKELSALNAKIEKNSIWGDFDPETVNELQKKSIYIYFCEQNKNQIVTKSENTFIFNIAETKNRYYFLLVSLTKLDESKLPLSDIDLTTSLSNLINKKDALQKKISEMNSKLANFASAKDSLKKEILTLKEKYSLCEAIDAMKEHGILSAITGYIPSPELGKISDAAALNGWGIIIEDVSPDDKNVPTKIEVPKIFRIIRPVFEFIGIEPGYDEVDVSVCFFFFFSIFFAMIIGDAGYGVLFLLFAIFAKMRFKGIKELSLPINLFIHLSICTIICGALCGSWFSIDSKYLPEPLRGLKSLSDSSIRDKTIQTFCFILAALHLSVGRLWRAFIIAGRKSLGQIGWFAMIWMNFFLIKGLLVDGGNVNFSLVIPLFIFSFILLLLFYVDWKNIGDIFNFPFSLIGSFSDVLSYIRLYAVGLASYYLALNVNQIGGMLLDVQQSPFISVLSFIFGILIIFLGHSLNIVLCLLGVLVHGVRLNALEFSNHMELQWKGIKYNPLKIKIENNN